MDTHSHTRHRRTIAIVGAAAVLATAAAIAVAMWTTGFVTSQGGGGGSAVNFTKITPLPFKGYPATVVLPNTTNPPGCTLPTNERPDPNLPPLSCRNSGAEPPPGTIPTADAAKRPPTPTPEKGTHVIDNPLFRFTVQVPDGWYSDMRPEGGEFHLYDAAGAAEQAKGADLPGGLVAHFTARAYVPLDDTAFVVPVIDKHLQAPNATFGGFPGAIWDEGPGEGLSHMIYAAFRKEAVVYVITINIADDADVAAIEADLKTVTALLATVTPY